MNEDTVFEPGQETATDTSAPELSNIEPIDDGPVDLDAPQEFVDDEGPDRVSDLPENDQNDPFFGYEEYEQDGKKYRVPAELKDGYLRQADYTRKTQEVAEMRRQADARNAEIEARSQATDEEYTASTTLKSVGAEIEKYAGVDWQKWYEEDFIEAQAQFTRFTLLKDSISEITNYQQNLRQQRDLNVEQETASRLQATVDFAKKSLPGWTPELDDKITAYAVNELGFDVDTLRKSYNPQTYRLLFEAYAGHKSITRQLTVKPTAPALEPMKTVSARGNASVTTDPSEMSMADYAKWADKKYKR